MISKVQKEHSMELYDAILHLQTREECFRFFQDLCSSNELYAIEQRFDVAKRSPRDRSMWTSRSGPRPGPPPSAASTVC